MTKDPSILLQHILESIALVEEYTSGVSKEEFLQKSELQDAVIRRIEVIGEAVKNIPEALKEKQPNVPWKQIGGMRDFLVHEYFSVDYNLAWGVVQKDIPSLKKAIEALLRDGGRGSIDK